ncbi:diguanylate cyclase domain-containing protein [Deinococcus lacus]|uniref:Diguanylate cyclase domain-containing protein n=1 Tax=Deinococcus lacus TaxID=392561 RepID=A0ABW1YD79_9DEIO
MPNRHHDSERITGLFFRVLLPVVGAVLLIPALYTNSAVAIPIWLTSGLLMLTALLSYLLPQEAQPRLRLGFAIALTLLGALLATAGPQMGVRGSMLHFSILLLFVPMAVMVWNLLFVDRARTGLILGLLLTLVTSVMILRWQNLNLGEDRLRVVGLYFLACLVASYVGWHASGLQRRLLDGEVDARHDPLTGLPNRRAFNEAARRGGHGSIAVLDIDHFKRINDSYGHEAGDRVLRAVADVLQDTLPAGQGGALFRWGGEEFAVLLPGQPLEAARELIEEVRREMSARSFVGREHITLSAGLSTYPPGGVIEAFGRADAALRRAKELGRNRVELAEPA